MEILLTLLAGFIGGYVIREILEKRKDKEILEMISKKESEYREVRTKLISINRNIVLEYDEKMSNLKANIGKYFSLYLSNKNSIEYYNSLCDRYINILKEILQKKEA